MKRQFVLLGISFFFWSCSNPGRTNEADSPTKPLKDTISIKHKVAGDQLNIRRDRISSWISETTVFIPIDSISLTDENRTRLSKIEKVNFLKTFGVQMLDEANAWGTFQLNKLIDFNYEEENNFHFKVIYAIDRNSPFIQLYNQTITDILFGGLIYGNVILFQLYFQSYFWGQYDYRQKVILNFGETKYSIYWDKVLLVGVSRLSAVGTIGKEQVFRYRAPIIEIPDGITTNTARCWIDMPKQFKKCTMEEFEAKATTFLSDYYGKEFPKNFAVSNNAPPAGELKEVRGYITKPNHYWEDVEIMIMISDIRPDGDKLLVQCTMGGQYLKINTPFIDRDAFDKSFNLGKDYSAELYANSYDLICNKFRLFLNK